MQIVLAVSLVQLLVGQMQRTGTYGQQQHQQLQPPQQPTQHALLYQQPQQHDLQHSLEDLVVWAGWEIQEAAVLVQLIQMES